jgi:hypothetical protein
MSHYHVVIKYISKLTNKAEIILEANYQDGDIKELIVKPYLANKSFDFRGRRIDPNNVDLMKIFASKEVLVGRSKVFFDEALKEASFENAMHFLKSIDVTNEFINSVPEDKSIEMDSKKLDQMVVMAIYETSDVLLKNHIDEVNRAYNCKCFTATFVLCRKVLENLILNILQEKYSSKTREDRAKYFDLNNGRNLDFGILLKNLRNSATDFIPKNKLVERICQLSECFKDEANDMTHSLYHIASKKEIDENKFQNILDLIKTLNASAS